MKRFNALPSPFCPAANLLETFPGILLALQALNPLCLRFFGCHCHKFKSENKKPTASFGLAVGDKCRY